MAEKYFNYTELLIVERIKRTNAMVVLYSHYNYSPLFRTVHPKYIRIPVDELASSYPQGVSGYWMVTRSLVDRGYDVALCVVLHLADCGGLVFGAQVSPQASGSHHVARDTCGDF
jgi:hypothetical protein